MKPIATLIAEEVAGEWNRTALAQAAQVFGADFDTELDGPASMAMNYRQQMELDGPAFTAMNYRQQIELDGPAFTAINYRLQNECRLRGIGADEAGCVIALDNRPGAQCVYDFRPPPETSCALVVGNEAKGIRRATIKRAFATVEIPVVSRNINCLNVAAAGAVALHYLWLPKSLPFPARTAESVRKNRSTLLIVGGPDHMELGSVIRSACAFGWDRVYLDDRFDVWYRCDRLIKSEGRGAARRGRNPIRVIPWSAEFERGFDRMLEPGSRESLHEQRLIGPRTLLVLKDDSSAAGLTFRQSASIILAEAARQLGRLDSTGIYLRGRADRYRKAIEEPPMESPTLDDLSIF